MKIVVLDSDPAFGSSAAPPGAQGTLDLSRLESLGTLEVHSRTEASDVVERAQGATVLLTNKVILGERELAQLPQLELISVLATGVNVIDLKAATDAKVTVCNVPGYSTMSTAQHTFAMLLELCNRVGLHSTDVAEGSWVSSPAFSYFKAPLTELDGLTLGVVGFGAIGKQVVKLGQAFGMKILVHTRTSRQLEGLEFVAKDELLRRSDVVALHCPLTDETRHYIDAPALQLMKKSAFLLNAARGPVVDEVALASALNSGQIAGAATDVLSQEPPAADCPLLSASHCVITPHIAWASQAARERLLDTTIRNIEAFRQGTLQNVVSGV